MVETGEPMLDVDIALHGRRFEASYFAVRDDRGELLAVGKAMIDVTARRQAEAARERLQAGDDRARRGGDRRRRRARDDRAVAAGAGGRHGRRAAASTPSAGGWRWSTTTASRRRRASRWHGVTLDQPMPATRAARTQESVFVPDEKALLELFPELAGTPYPRAGSYAALPLLAYGSPQGVLSVGFGRRVAFDADQRALLNALAGQAAIAIARAQLYEREHTVSQTLQASLLPRALPAVPGLDLAGRLESGAKGVEVGGDFYDAFAIGDGAWGIAIGDVCGKGVDAAALTALARHTVRAAAHAHESPAAVLDALNRAVLDESRPGQFLTAVFARLTPRPDGGFRLTLACGGHPPPVVVDAAGAPRELECSGHAAGRRRRPADRRHRRSTSSPATRCCSTPTA